MTLTEAPLHVVVVHRDQPEVCAATVEALRSQAPGRITVSVVDNSVDPAHREKLRRLVDGAEVLDAGGNLGFGPGANLGLRRWLSAGVGDWVAVAPHDARPEAGCIDRLLAEVASRPRAGLVSAEFGPGFDFVPAVDWVIGGFYKPAVRGQGWQDADYPHGTLLLARREMLEEVGLFDERYFAYCEEVDLALRARAAGWEVGIVWGAVVANGRLPSQLVADYLQVRNTLLLVRSRFGRYPAAVRCVLAGFAVLGRVRRDPRRALVHLRLEGRAVADFARGRFGPPPDSVLLVSAGATR